MIDISNLNFGYSKTNLLFKDLSLKASEGSIIGLLGKNGAGKSTLLKLMAGLLKPQNGKLSIMDEVPYQRKPSFLQDLYFVPEEFSLPPISINCYINALAPLYPSFDRDKMISILTDFELNDKQKFNKMSYGQRKKFLIAFALSSNCKFLVLDEPTNGLDIPSKSLFRKIMAGALSDEQMVVISTHQVKDVENLIDRILLIEDGQFIFNSSILDVTDNFAFHTVSDLSGEDYLYHEAAPGGYRIIKAKNGVETPIDIELLFNAVVNGTKLEVYEPSI
ncbi:ABC transporter ATP-binding protein [bacterium]|nr:ABC transporter ATP-binding protein [bacterium]